MRFIDLNRQYINIEKQIEESIQSVLQHGQYIMGPEVNVLEKELKNFIGVKHVFACSSGTDALQMALMAWGIGKGDAVFTSVFSFFATAEVIANVQATPIFVDIQPNTFNIDQTALNYAIENTINEGKLKPRVIIPVDLFGLPAEYDAINKTAKKFGLVVLEDAAQSFGAQYKGRMAGSFGDISATSFFPAKPLGCYGDGGAVFTNDDDIAQILQSIRVHGQGQNKYENIRMGLNARMDTMQAAILLEKLKIFPHEILRRNEIAKQYDELLKGFVVTPEYVENCVCTWAQYSVLAKDCKERKAIMDALEKSHIPSAVYYDKPLHLQKAFDYLGCQKGDFPVAEEISQRILSLPMHAYLHDDEISYIAHAIKMAIPY
jgi:dTDP-4-amino-4,6-dideoxygalactose transaminase